MFDEILASFSEDELLSFLPRSSISFLNMLNESDEAVLAKSDLVNIVKNFIGSDFVFEKKLLTLLIERSPKSVIKEFFAEINLAEHDIGASHYDAVTSWALNNEKEFAEKIGMLDEYQAASCSVVTVDTIKKIKPLFSLYPYQKEISEKVLNILESDNRILIHLPTGAGKTRTSMNICSEFLRRRHKSVILWLADREELCIQAFDEFRKAWTALGDRDISIYGYFSNSDESLDGIDDGLIVASVQKLHALRSKDKRKYNLIYKRLVSSVDLVIFDEAHKIIAPTYKDVVADFASESILRAKLLGLTATPGRNFSKKGLTDGDAELASFFKNKKVSMSVPGYLSPIDYLVHNGYLAKAEFISLNYENSEVTGYSLKGKDQSETNKALANLKQRNKRIIDAIKVECSRGATVIVFANTVQHSRDLAVALCSIGVKAASIDSVMDSEVTRRAKIHKFKNGKLQVLCNFGVLVAGFDAPKTNVAVITKPTNSLVEYLQMAGRAMRGTASGGNDTCRIYNVIDDIPEFNSINIGFDYWNNMWKE